MEQCIKILKIDDEWVVCGQLICSSPHMVSDGHDFVNELSVESSHDMVIHPIDGIFCIECKSYSYDKAEPLKEPCPGPREWGYDKKEMTNSDPVIMDLREPGEAYCSNCPDHEACHGGWPCSVVKQVNKEVTSGTEASSRESAGQTQQRKRPLWRRWFR